MTSIENTAYYLPLPTKVFAHLGEAPNNNLYPWERVLITSSLDYGTPLYRSSVLKKVAALDLPQNKVYSIVASIWDLRLTKEEFWSQEKLQSLRACPCEEHVSFPLAGEVRTLLNVHHSRDLTRSQRKLLTNLITATHQCATDLFDLIHGICPDRADVVHRSLLGIAYRQKYDPKAVIDEELKDVKDREFTIFELFKASHQQKLPDRQKKSSIYSPKLMPAIGINYDYRPARKKYNWWSPTEDEPRWHLLSTENNRNLRRPYMTLMDPRDGSQEQWLYLSEFDKGEFFKILKMHAEHYCKTYYRVHIMTDSIFPKIPRWVLKVVAACAGHCNFYKIESREASDVTYIFSKFYSD